MLVRISGIVTDIAEESVVVDRDGLAREVLVPVASIVNLAPLRGQPVTLYTIEYLEGNQGSGHLTPVMVGFVSPEDRLFFQRFVTVKGIGPRKALRALAEPVRRIASWIKSADAKALARLPGIGKKTAEMIVASLRDSLDDLALPEEASPAGAAVAAVPSLTDEQNVALEILVAWGDGRSEAVRWLQTAAQQNGELAGPDEWVRAAYRVKSGVPA